MRSGLLITFVLLGAYTFGLTKPALAFKNAKVGRSKRMTETSHRTIRPADLHRTLERVANDPTFTDLRGIPGLQFDLKYASKDNFVGMDIYGPFREPYLHHEAAKMVAQAAKLLQEAHPGYSLLVLDALRPGFAQRLLFEHVRGTSQQKYVKDPDIGSIHSYGCAVDLTVLDAEGRALDMGTGFDALTLLSEPSREEEFLREGMLTRDQIGNRLVLRNAMKDAGFHSISHEWWHFEAFPADYVRSNFKIVE